MQMHPVSPMSEREEYENFFFYFVEAVEVLSNGPESQRDVLGNFHVAWKMQHDVVENYAGMKAMATQRLQPTQVEVVQRLIGLLEDLPAGALGSWRAAVDHSSWQPVRKLANAVLIHLADAIEANRAYFAMR
jgi:hypothetical protein